MMLFIDKMHSPKVHVPNSITYLILGRGKWFGEAPKNEYQNDDMFKRDCIACSKCDTPLWIP